MSICVGYLTMLSPSQAIQDQMIEGRKIINYMELSDFVLIELPSRNFPERIDENHDESEDRMFSCRDTDLTS
jgi:hypothetical protein